MKLKKSFITVASAALIVSLTFVGCKKDSSKTTDNSTTLTSSEQTQVLNSDAQDAIADKTEQDVDKSLDVLQNNNYDQNSLKSDSNPITITVDHPDSTTFPKVVTITFTNYTDSLAAEKFTKNGTITVTITADASNKKLITRVQKFSNFSIATDSTTVTVNGTRTVTRTNASNNFAFNGLKVPASFKSTVIDHIQADLHYSVNSTSEVDSFTRVVDKNRTSIVYFKNVGGEYWKTKKYVSDGNKDSVTYTGSVTGNNEKGFAYSKIVSVSTPLVVQFFNGKPYVTSGTMLCTVTDPTSTANSKAYTITYKESSSNAHNTLVTVTNDKTGKSYSYERKLGRKFRKW